VFRRDDDERHPLAVLLTTKKRDISSNELPSNENWNRCDENCPSEALPSTKRGLRCVNDKSLSDFHQKWRTRTASFYSIHSKHQRCSKPMQRATIVENLTTNITKAWARSSTLRPNETAQCGLSFVSTVHSIYCSGIQVIIVAWICDPRKECLLEAADNGLYCYW